ncbi:hypothetical protein BC938DRAFT_477471 [Jimgerdemannia flammicorona]|uniref:Uncharacterized protein n=1 Tax=Jimgerdemannia flammicorona TaxID=994334 RepID=A0A433QP91_9FUNG|nr:hypothetical protein BC938DRAFT_477471 [Jimgerdemannia flammicorona]
MEILGIYIPRVNPMAIALGSVFQHITAYVLYGPVYGSFWWRAMCADKGNGNWLDGERKVQKRALYTGGLYVMAIAQVAGFIGLLLNLTDAQTFSHATQLGLFLYFGILLPSIAEEYIMEQRSTVLIGLKALRGFIKTVGVSLIMFSWGTR